MTDDEIYPRSANVVIFTDAYDAHKTVAMLRLWRNQTATAETTRIALFDMCTAIALRNRNKLLDEFALEWIKYRKLEDPNG